MPDAPLARRPVPARFALYAATAIAFSPVIVDLVLSAPAVDGRWVILVGPILLLLAARRQSAAVAPRTRSGIACLALGLGLELLGIAVDVWTIARLGLPVAAIGLGLLGGWPDARRMALLFFAVPVPITLTMATTPTFESHYAELAVAVLHGGLGLDVQASGPLLRSGAAQLELYASDNGVWAVYVLAAFGWYRVVAYGGTTRRAFSSAALLCLAALPVQLVGVLVAALVLALGHADCARHWLDEGMHAALGLGLLGIVSRRDRSPSPERPLQSARAS